MLGACAHVGGVCADLSYFRLCVYCVCHLANTYVSKHQALCNLRIYTEYIISCFNT